MKLAPESNLINLSGRGSRSRMTDDKGVLEQILSALEGLERRLQAVEKTAHKQVTIDDLSGSLQRQFRENNLRNRRLC